MRKLSSIHLLRNTSHMLIYECEEPTTWCGWTCLYSSSHSSSVVAGLKLGPAPLMGLLLFVPRSNRLPDNAETC